MALKPNVTDREMNKFEETPSGEHAIRVLPFGTLDIPVAADHIAVTYPNTVTEIYTYKDGGASGTVLKTITVVYVTASKDDLLSVSWT